MSKHVPVKSARGVYYDLSKSPYEYLSPYGDLFKFSSQKKLDMYTRDVAKEKERLDKVLKRNGLQLYIPMDSVCWMYRVVYHALYNNMVK